MKLKLKVLDNIIDFDLQKFGKFKYIYEAHEGWGGWLKNRSAAPNFGARGFYTKSLSSLSQFVTANKDDRVSRQL